jgi:hypothetical protein
MPLPCLVALLSIYCQKPITDFNYVDEQSSHWLYVQVFVDGVEVDRVVAANVKHGVVVYETKHMVPGQIFNIITNRHLWYGRVQILFSNELSKKQYYRKYGKES